MVTWRQIFTFIKVCFSLVAGELLDEKEPTMGVRYVNRVLVATFYDEYPYRQETPKNPGRNRPSQAVKERGGDDSCAPASGEGMVASGFGAMF